VDRADDDRVGAEDGRHDRREALHDLTGVLAAAALRVEVARRRHDDPSAVQAELAVVEAAVAEARRIVAALQSADAAADPAGR
jgi:hypothetical protein